MEAAGFAESSVRCGGCPGSLNHPFALGDLVLLGGRAEDVGHPYDPGHGCDPGDPGHPGLKSLRGG